MVDGPLADSRTAPQAPATGQPPDPGASPKGPFGARPAISWVLYDFANTVYIATVTFVFTPYAEQLLGGLKWHGIVNFLSMAAAALLVPFFGALADTTGRSRGYLTISTLACIAALGCWHFDLGGSWLLVLFFLANLSYNVALLFYNALLTSVARPEHTGRISAIGVGIGYLGTILVALVGIALAPSPRTMFLIAAGVFLALSLPCMLWVRDRRQPALAGQRLPPLKAMRTANGALLETLRSLPQHRPLMWFLVGNFCLADVLNTAVVYFAAFTKKVFAEQAAATTGIPFFGTTLVGDEGLDTFFYTAALGLNVLAMIFGLCVGRWVERSPLTVMRVAAIALLFALLGGAYFGGKSAHGYLATLVALGAFGLTCIWSAGRKVVVLLAPPDQIGRYFGLYGITVKLSVFGGVVYGLVNDAYGSKPAMLAQTTQLLFGLVCLFMVRVDSPSRTTAR
ncbi:MAG: MFS transporter [Planctomycetota bacterium]